MENKKRVGRKYATTPLVGLMPVSRKSKRAKPTKKGVKKVRKNAKQANKAFTYRKKTT
jgi:hypothetical protein